jgi:hypothetical protein
METIMAASDFIARTFSMDEESWRRHANPWSVWTRFAAIPAMILAVWSREWLGWGALFPVGLVAVWLWLNVKVFRPVETPVAWASRGIYGERLWLLDRAAVPPGHRIVLRWLILPGLAGFALIIWGLVRLEIWPTLFGATILVMAQLWRIDRFSLLYEMRSGRPQDRGAAGQS